MWSTGEGNGKPLQYSCLDNPMNSMKCSLGISSFPEEISRLSHSIVCLYFFALIISPCYSLEHCIQMDISFLFSFAFSSIGIYLLLFSQLFGRSPQSAILHFFFLGMVLITASCTVLQTSVHSSSGTWCITSSPLNLFLFPLYNHKRFYLGHT